MVRNEDLADDRNKRAFLLTPREKFVLKQNLGRAYDHAFLDIGYGVTISGPHLVGRMTSTINPQVGEKVLEIGTGSGYQSAYLSQPDRQGVDDRDHQAAGRAHARHLRRADQATATPSSRRSPRRTPTAITAGRRTAPFDKIIVTCGIDHVPPPLLQQLKAGGTMVIPVGPPGAQHVLKVVKTKDADGSITVTRSDIYNGRIVPFVPFTKLEGERHQGHAQQLTEARRPMHDAEARPPGGRAA